MQREQYKPALTMLLQQQQQGPQSPYRSKQAARGLGRQQSQTQQQQLQAKSAKGLLRSASAANMPTAQRLAPLPQRQTGGQQQQPGQSELGASAAPADLWQSDPSLPPSAQGRRPEQQAQQQQPATRQLRGSASSGVLVAARPGESLESQAYRSMPAHTYAGSHFYSPAPSNAQRLVHTHQYPDGSVVEECACERGRTLVQQEQGWAAEEKEQRQQTPTRASADAAAAPLRLTPSQLARAGLGYERRQRPADTSRQHSHYASQYKAQPLQAFSKMGRGYFASHNKSYVRSCLQDPGYGFQLEELRQQQQNDPELAHYAAEIKREHVDPSRRLANIIAPVNLPDTTHHKDFAAPSADLIRSYKRVGKDYRQAGNKSYIRLNLVDPSVAAAPGLLAVTGAGAASNGSSAGVAVPVPLSEISSATPSISIRVPFTATTTHATSFQDHTAHIPGMRAARAKAIRFGSETGPHENIWQGQWDDNMD